MHKIVMPPINKQFVIKRSLNTKQFALKILPLATTH